MIIVISLINIITISLLLIGVAIYSMRLVSRKAKEYSKRGRLYKRIILLTIVFLVSSGFAYMFDVGQYLNGLMGFYFYPHSLLPIDVHVLRWENDKYFLYPNDITGHENSKTLLKVNCSYDFCLQSRNMTTTDSTTWLGIKSPYTSLYHPLQCMNVDGITIQIPMATIVSYGFNKTDFVMQIQDTIGQHHWIRVLPSQYQYYPTNGKKAKSELHLNYCYVLLSENDITKKYYHWIQLRNLSKAQKIFRNTCSLLWLVSFFILLPVIRLMWIITIVRLLVQKYNQYHKCPKQVY